MAERTPEPRPWEQRPDESAKAYAAFLAYRDLGAKRSVDDAAAQLEGRQKGGKRAARRYWQWSSEYDWIARARAHDEYRAAVRQASIEKAAATSGEKWVARQDEDLEEEWSLGRQMMRQAKLLASFPVVEQRQGEDGKTVIQPIDPEMLKAAAAIAKVGAAMTRGAIDAALGRRPDAPPVPPTPMTSVLSESERRLEDWKAYQRTQMLRISSQPPAPDPEPPPPPERNGSYTPPTPASAT